MFIIVWNSLLYCLCNTRQNFLFMVLVNIFQVVCMRCIWSCVFGEMVLGMFAFVSVILAFTLFFMGLFKVVDYY